MLIGVPREVKNGETRVGITPAGVAALVQRGHQVHVEQGAGNGVGYADSLYSEAGARIVSGAADAYACEFIVKVKEIQPQEFALLRKGSMTFCYQHLSADAELLGAVLSAGTISLAYETVTGADGGLPLLAPMSRIAGRLAIQAGMWAMQTDNGGAGVLLPGLDDVAPGTVVVLGAGNVGANAAHVAVGIGARTIVFARSRERLAALEQRYPGRIETHVSEPAAIAALCAEADLIVGSVLTRGRLSPKLLTRATVAAMRPGSVIVDVGIDQGGIAETSRPTSLSAPLYKELGVQHYCVPNMPATCARTATMALSNATLPYVLEIANRGLRGAMQHDAGIAAGVLTGIGAVASADLADESGRPLQPF